MHKGMPEMISYFMGKPKAYCSHAFRSPYLYPLVTLALAELMQSSTSAAARELSIGVGETLTIVNVERATVPFLSQRVNYHYRPDELERFPIYFFVAASVIHEDTTQNT